MSSVPPPYLGSQTAEDAKILSRDIPWETYVTARLITDTDLSLIRRYDKRSMDLRVSMLVEAGPAHIEAFMNVLKAVTKEETVQYVLALLVQLIQENPLRARLFHVQSDQHSTAPEPYTVLLRLLSREDWPTQEMAAKLLTAAIDYRLKKSGAYAHGMLSGDVVAPSVAAAYGGPDQAEAHISSFVDWLVAQLRRPSNPAKSVALATCCLSALLKERGTRQLLLRAGGGVSVLAPLLKASNSPTNSQLLYELCLCVWQMTYLKAAAEIMGQSGVVGALVQVARTAQKEKVFRVAILSLRNLLNHDELGLASDMVAAGLGKVVATRQMQTWGDEDIGEMLSFLEEKLKESVKLLTNFDLYKREVLSGSLEWSPMHTNEVFWRENIDKFEDKDFQVLRMLLKLIETSREAKTVAVGCSDIGMFIKHHSQGRYIVNDLRGKELVMRHMANPDPEVQKQALLCVQKLMLCKDNAEFLVSAA